MADTKTNDYQAKITVSKSPREVFEGICAVQDWWVGDVSGSALKVGDEFSYRYKDFHMSRQKVTDLVPDQKIVWRVEEANLKFTQDKSEWVGTQLIFEISAKSGKTEILVTHRGLTPKLECFDACSGGWEFYIKKSLESFLTKGKGLDPGF